MDKDYQTRIRDLPPEARRRAESFLEEGNYYGWRLQGVVARIVGDMLQCTLDFDRTKIVFLSRTDGWRPPAGRAPVLSAM